MQENKEDKIESAEKAFFKIALITGGLILGFLIFGEIMRSKQNKKYASYRPKSMSSHF